MARKIDDDDYDFDSLEQADIADDLEEKMDSKKSALQRQSEARRRLELLMENRKLERIINSDRYDWE